MKKKELEQYTKDKTELHNTFEKITQIEEEIRQWTWEYEVLLQQYDYLTHERDDVYKRFQDSILEVQQKVGLKNLILEKKLETEESLYSEVRSLYDKVILLIFYWNHINLFTFLINQGSAGARRPPVSLMDINLL